MHHFSFAKAAMVAATAAMATASPSFATQTENEPPANVLQVEVPDISLGERIICRRMPPPAGSRIGARNICKTAAEWAQLESDRDYFTDRLSIRAQANNSK
ncbi:MAG: hypothetical protein HKN78_09150 [Sphingomonadaceae bacterium]|nr:hypothetical protein [Sphingomonadaceae bacterium]